MSKTEHQQKLDDALAQACDLCELDRVKSLIAGGADVMTRNGSLISQAANDGVPQLLEILVKAPTFVAGKLDPALVAEVGGYNYPDKMKISMLRTLLNAGMGVNATDRHGKTAIENAARDGDCYVVKFLETRGAKRRTGCETGQCQNKNRCSRRA